MPPSVGRKKWADLLSHGATHCLLRVRLLYIWVSRKLSWAREVRVSSTPRAVVASLDDCGRHHLRERSGHGRPCRTTPGGLRLRFSNLDRRRRYQAVGTRSAAMVGGAKTIRIHREWIPVNAEVVSLQGMSAHADREGLPAWIAKLPRPPGHVYVTHG